MIGFLKGTVHTKNLDGIILLSGLVGYNVALSQGVLAKIIKSQDLELYIYTHVREDALDLYGFLQEDELALFKLLISVSGIGAKTAMATINKGSSAIKNAILNSDVEFFTDVPRLGRKNAQKLIIELKNKIGSSIFELDLSFDQSQNTEVSQALESMGYTKQEIASVLKKIPDPNVSTEDKIRFALKNLGK